MKRVHGLMALFLAGTVSATALLTPIAARASEEGKRNTAIGLGALSAGLLITQKNKLPGLLAAGGAVYAYTQYDNSIRDRHRRERRERDYIYREDRNRDERAAHRDRDSRRPEPRDTHREHR